MYVYIYFSCKCSKTMYKIREFCNKFYVLVFKHENVFLKINNYSLTQIHECKIKS